MVRRRRNIRRRRAPVRRVRRNRLGNGFVMRPRRTPPEIIQAPYNQLSLTFRHVGAELNLGYTIADIHNQALQQIGIVGADKKPLSVAITYRISSISAWEMSGQSLLLYAYDLIEAGPEELQVIEDQPGRNQWAVCGYKWPKSHETVTFHSTDDKDRAIFGLRTPSGATNVNVFVRLRVLWRCTQRISPRLSIYERRIEDANMTM